MVHVPLGPHPSGTGSHPVPVPRTHSRAGRTLRTALLIVLLTLVGSLLVKTFLLRMFFIPSSSMEPTLQEGDRVAVNLLASGPDELERGDVVVFRDTKGWLPPATAPANPLLEAARFVGIAPEDEQSHVVKRVVGLPGDTVEWHPGQEHVSVNGHPVTETHLAPGVPPSEVEFEVTVPAGSLWVLGDNRPTSADSRRHQDGPGAGFVAQDDVVGRAEAIVWPLDRIGLAGSDPAPFAEVPSPEVRALGAEAGRDLGEGAELEPDARRGTGA